MNNANTFSYQELSYVTRGLYARQLDRYVKLFPAKKFFIVKSEDLFDRPETVLKSVFRFLRLNDDFSPIDTGPKNKGNYQKNFMDKASQEAYQWLANFYKLPSSILSQRYGIEF